MKPTIFEYFDHLAARLRRKGMREENVHLQAADILKGAHDKINTKGWIQRREYSASGYCMIGAMRASDGTKPDGFNEAKRIVLNLTGATAIESWNDMSGRTKADVLKYLKAAENCEREMA